MTSKEKFLFDQLTERCNTALADNTLLKMENQDLRSELKECYSELASIKHELRSALDLKTTDLLEGLEPIEIAGDFERK